MTIRIDHHHYFHFDSAQLDRIELSLVTIIGKANKIMATMQDVLTDLDDIKTKATDYIAGRDAVDVQLRKTKATDYIAGRDAVDVQLRADLAAALAAAGIISPAEQADIDAAFTKAEDAKALLTPPVVTPTP